MRSRGRMTTRPKIFHVFLHLLLIDASSVNPKEIKTLLANGLIAFFIRGNPIFSNGAKRLPRNPPHCIILDN